MKYLNYIFYIFLYDISIINTYSYIPNLISLSSQYNENMINKNINNKNNIYKLERIIVKDYNLIQPDLLSNLKKSIILNIVIKLPKFNIPNFNKNWKCNDSWDCDYPEKCCDYKIFKMCCMEGVPIRVWYPYNPQYAYIYIKNDIEEDYIPDVNT